jgi:hypothetical protein
MTPCGQNLGRPPRDLPTYPDRHQSTPELGYACTNAWYLSDRYVCRCTMAICVVGQGK